MIPQVLEPHSFTVNQSLLCSYVAYLASQGLKHAIIEVYLSAVRNLQISYGLDDPFACMSSYASARLVRPGNRSLSLPPT